MPPRGNLPERFRPIWWPWNVWPWRRTPPRDGSEALFDARMRYEGAVAFSDAAPELGKRIALALQLILVGGVIFCIARDHIALAIVLGLIFLSLQVFALVIIISSGQLQAWKDEAKAKKKGSAACQPESGREP